MMIVMVIVTLRLPSTYTRIFTRHTRTDAAYNVLNGDSGAPYIIIQDP